MWTMVVYKPTGDADLQLELEDLQFIGITDPIVFNSRTIGLNELFKASKVDYQLLLIKSANKDLSRLAFVGFDLETVNKAVDESFFADGNGSFAMNTEHEVVYALAAMTDAIVEASFNNEKMAVFTNLTFIDKLGETFVCGLNEGIKSALSR